MPRSVKATPLVLTLVLLVSISTGVSVPTVTAQHDGSSDRAALVALYNATNGANWKANTNWLSDVPISQWHGIFTNPTNGRVTGIVLSNNQLTGRIPTELGNLSNLEYLGLNSNQLTGPIPPELGDLNNLRWLHLSQNQLTGGIPTELGNPSSLKYLFLDVNQLTGGIPTELGNLSNLEYLGLSSNQLTGSIPAALGNLANLEWLDLNRNQLTGSIPAALGNLTNLEDLYLSFNQLTGCIPAGLRDVPDNDLDRLGLDFCAAPADPCLEVESLGALTAPVTRMGMWADDCMSEGQANNYARYYTFTLSEETRVAIYLTSSRDTYLYLRQGEGRTGTVVHQNNNVGRGNINSRIEETLADGTYTVEATTYYRRAVTGDFTLAVRPVVCVQQLGTLTETYTTPGAWSDDCVSARQTGNYHRSYRLTLGAPTDLQIDLTSERDTYLYLLREDGTVLDQNNNVGRGNINSRIVQTALAAGTYTVEATTYYRNPVTGNFVLNIGLTR